MKTKESVLFALISNASSGGSERFEGRRGGSLLSGDITLSRPGSVFAEEVVVFDITAETEGSLYTIELGK